MLALFYLLGFLSGAAAAIVVHLIIRAKSKRSAVCQDDGFTNILNY